MSKKLYESVITHDGEHEVRELNILAETEWHWTIHTGYGHRIRAIPKGMEGYATTREAALKTHLAKTESSIKFHQNYTEKYIEQATNLRNIIEKETSKKDN